MTNPNERDERLARLFHDIYEQLAPSYGYETRDDTKEFDSTTPNGKLMIAVASEVNKYFDAYTESVAKKWEIEARIKERKEVALDNYRGQTFSSSTDYRGKFDKFIRNNELRISQLSKRKEQSK